MPTTPTLPIGPGRERMRQSVVGRRGRPRPARQGADTSVEEDTTMGKTGRKRRARKKKGANHGKRPNA